MPSHGRTLRKRTKRESGSAIVEFALGSGVLLAAFTGIFQYGYSFYVYNNLQNAVNNGAKYAASRVYDSTTTTPSTCFVTAVKDMVAYGDPSGSTTASVAPGLSPSNVNVTITFANSVPSSATVSISSYTINAAIARISLSGKPQITYPYLGRYAPGETCSQ